MSKPNPNYPPVTKPLKTEGTGPKAFLRADYTQLAVRICFLDGRKHTWPYAHLCSHRLEGGKLRIYFSEHLVIVHGRYLEGADQGLCLQSLVYLQEVGTRRREALGEPDLPEDQPAIDSIEVYERSRD